MREQFIKEFQISPIFVFPTSSNTVDHLISRTIGTELGKLVHDLKNVDKFFHATAIRKMWDLHFYRNKNSLGHMFPAHFERIGRTELNALKNYVAPGVKIQTFQIYLDQLLMLDNQCTSVHQTPLIENP